MKKILVTGGAGFIGSHVVEGLLADDWRVVVLDDFSTGKLENLPSDNERLQIVKGSIADPEKVAAAMGGCNAVIHLAAIASVQASIDEVVPTHQVNLTGTLVVLEEARKAGVKDFAYASSAAVYGDASWGAVSETDPVSPISPYAIDKLSGEYFLKFYSANYGIRHTAFRFFNVYGPRQDPSSQYSGVISKFISSVSAGLPVRIFGDGNQTRDFVFVKDISAALIGAIGNPAMQGRTVNLGRGVSVSLQELVATICSIAGTAVRIEYLPSRAGDIRHSLANMSLLASISEDLQPRTSLTSGLSQTMKQTRILGS